METTVRKDGITFIGKFIMAIAARGYGERIPEYVKEICEKDVLDNLSLTIKATSAYLVKLHLESSKRIKG